MALRAANLQGESAKAAIDVGKSWGLKSLEPVVLQQLALRDASTNTLTPISPGMEKPVLVFPRIKTAGGVYALAKSVTMPAADREYRLVIDATTAEVSETGINRRLETAARAINLYALAGVSADRLKLAVVIHGKATPALLADASYQKQFDKPNPNAALIAELDKAGVQIALCGQAMMHAGYTMTDVRDDVHVELSALTTLADLQSAGYQLIP